MSDLCKVMSDDDRALLSRLFGKYVCRHMAWKEGRSQRNAEGAFVTQPYLACTARTGLFPDDRCLAAHQVHMAPRTLSRRCGDWRPCKVVNRLPGPAAGERRRENG